MGSDEPLVRRERDVCSLELLSEIDPVVRAFFRPFSDLLVATRSRRDIIRGVVGDDTLACRIIGVWVLYSNPKSFLFNHQKGPVLGRMPVF